MPSLKPPLLFSRQKVLLALIQAFGGGLGRTKLQKCLFLFTQRNQNNSYDFVPYKYGCYSFQAEADLQKLNERGFLEVGKNPEPHWKIVNRKEDYLSMIESEVSDKLLELNSMYSKVSIADIKREVYSEYPYFAISSENPEGFVDTDGEEEIRKARPSMKGYAFLTIGYEGKSFDGYLNELIQNGVRALFDVRKNPLSRRYGFSKTVLSETLEKLGIAYLHFPLLGIESAKRKNLVTPADYEKLFKEYKSSTLRKNTEEIDRLCVAFKKYKRVAVTCFEADHGMCHRNSLAEILTERENWGYKIKHL